MYAWLNASYLDVIDSVHGQSGQPMPEGDEDVDWVADGGSIVIVVVLVVKRDAESVAAALQRLTTLLETVTASLTRVRQRRRAFAAPIRPATPAPHGENFTDSFLVQWRAVMRDRAQEARSVYV